MQKQRKIIGVLISLADGAYQKKLIEGIERRAYALDYDVMVFSTFIKDGSSPEWQFGEQNIFSLINFDLLDGIIIAPDTIQIPGALDKLIEKIRKHFSKPVVSVEIDIDGFHNICSDDVTPIKKIVSHLIEDHHLSDIVFVTGTKGHPHAEKRLSGYYEALVEHGLTIDNNRVYYGDFWYTCGEETVTKILFDFKQLPQAIACACDAMAIGICEALKKRGIRVPEDVVVTGYDSVPAGVNYYPCITSAVVPSQITGEQAVNYIHSKLNKLHTPGIIENTIAISAGQSCGCGINLNEQNNIRTQKWRDEDLTMDFSSYSNNMLEGLLSESEMHNYLEVLNWYTYQLGTFDTFCLCLCENWDSLNDKENGGYLKDGYTPKMQFVLEHGSSIEHVHVDTERSFKTDEVLPSLYYKRAKPTTFFFTPVHFNDRCFGYSAISYGDEICSYDTNYRIWIRFVNNSLESLRRQRKLKLMYRKMRESAVIDTMTGIYNRNGFNLYADEIFRSAKENDQKLLVISGDLNRLKYINDTFGHLQGDAVIKAVAKAFKTVCGSDKICFRLGGDEFIILDIGEYSAEQIRQIKDDIRAILSENEKNFEGKYPLSVSLGVFYGHVDNAASIEVPISIADAEMFREKQEFQHRHNIKR